MTYVEPTVESSYKKTPGYGRVFYDLVMDLKPKKIIEFGVRHGYSTIAMGQALRDLGEGHIWAHDLWSQHPDDFYATTENLMECANSIEIAGLSEYITLEGKDFFEWIKNPGDFDLLHVDIDNTGDVIEVLHYSFPGKDVIFEGGTKERDEVHWMKGSRAIVGSAPYKLIHSGFPGLGKLI